MAGQDDQRPTPAGTPVPDLIERYRSRRDAWIAQADELARLRDEVRGSAEREAMEIVTAARRDVRRIVTEARRELLVLSAQVQAALGEAAAKADPATLLQKAGITGSEETTRFSLRSSHDFESESVESGVEDILKDMQADVTALAEGVRALPRQATSLPHFGNEPAEPATPAAPRLVASTHPVPATQPTQTAADEERPPSAAALSEAASRALLSSPYSADSVPVAPVRRLRAFAAASVAAGLLVLLGTFWWLRNAEMPVEPARRIAADTATPSNSTLAVPAPASSPSEPALAVRKAVAARSASLSVVAEAIREVWLRTTIDGREDLGRTLSAGEVVNLSADQSISLRVGDAGALVVSVKGGEKRPLGRDGQVVTRQFVVEDVRSAAVGTPSGPVAPPTAAVAAPRAAAALFGPGSVRPPLPEASAPAQAAAAPQPVATGNAAPVNPPAAAAVPPSRPAPSATAESASAEGAVVAAARQWLDAYYRQDKAAMAALSTENVTLADERRPDERLPTGLADVKRTLDRPSVQIAAETAVLTAMMTEQSAALPAPRVSPVAQVWVLSGGQWKVRQARFVSESRLNQAFR
jgi:hypothetical protein